MVNRKSIQDSNTEIPTYPDPTYRPPPKPVKSLMPEVPRNIAYLTKKIIWTLRKILHFEKV